MHIKCSSSKVTWEKIYRYHVWNYEEVRVQGVQPATYITVQKPQQAALLSTFQNIKWWNTINQVKFCIPVNSLKALPPKSSINQLLCIWGYQSKSHLHSKTCLSSPPSSRAPVVLYPHVFPSLDGPGVIRRLISPCNLPWWYLGSAKKQQEAPGQQKSDPSAWAKSGVTAVSTSLSGFSPSAWWRVNRHAGIAS